MATADGATPPPRPAEAPLEPAVTDIGILVAPPPRGLGLDLEDRALAETLKRNPEVLTKDAVNHLLKRRFVTAIAGKVFAVRASSLPNVVRAIARVLHLSNAHSRKLWEEFRGCGALEELMTRMGVIVGEGRYMLAGDLLQAFLPLLYVGEGLEEAAGDECGVDFLADLSLGGKGKQQPQSEPAAPETDPASLVKNKYVYNALVMAFYKIAPYHAQEGAEADTGFVKYCSDFLDVIMRVIASGGGNLRALMAGHPLQPILQQLGELPPEVTYKVCTWVSFLCTYNRCAPITELSTMVNAARLLFERSAHSRDPQESFKVFNVVRSLRYVVTSTIQADARFKLVWNEAGLVDALLGVIGTSKGDRAGVAPFTISLAVDTLLWLVRGCAKNARLVVASGGARTLEALLAKDTHFPEGVSLWTALLRELAAEMTTGPGAASAAGQVEDEQSGVAREFADLLGVAVTDLERRFARAVAGLGAGKDGALSGAFHNGGVVALAYVRGLTATAEVPYARATWAPRAGQQPAPLAEGKEFHQCILLLHALTSLLVPPDGLELAQDGRPGTGQAAGAAQAGSGHQAGVPALLETAYDGMPFLVPMVLAAVRRHRGQALRWLTLKAPVAPAVGAAFNRALRVRRAFVRAGALERILGVLEQCVAQVEADAWAPERLCTGEETGQRIAFGPFVGAGDNDSYASGGNSQVGLANDDNTALAEFLGSTLLAFAAAMSRLHPPNSIEGAAAIAHGGDASFAGGMASRASERHSLALFRQLAGLLLRLLRKTFPRIQARDAGGARAAQAVLFFVARFLLSTALGGYSPLVEMVLNPRAVGLSTGGGASSPPPMPMPMPLPMPMPMAMGAAPGDVMGGGVGVGSPSSALLGHQEVHSPRALLLTLELLAEYPVATPGFDFLLPVLQALADFVKRLCKAQERNLELALDAGLVRSALWACLRPAASHQGVEAALTGLLAFAASRRTAPEDLRLWFNAVLFDYDLQEGASAQQGQGQGRIEARRLSLLRALVDVANGLPSPSTSPALDNGAGAAGGAEFLARPNGHIFGSAPIVLFDPPGGDERQGPRLAIPSLHPEGFEEAANGPGGSTVVGSLVGGGAGSGPEAGRVRAWPPARGYTVSAWFCIEAYDRFTRRLPLLTLTEDGEVLMALEINDGVLSLATGPGKDAQAVCDRLPRLQEGEWYHLTVAHHRARNRAMQAVVYLNGSAAQTVRLAYPRATQGLHRVQLVMGQARASPTAGPGAAAPIVTRVKWALGPMYILAEPLSDASALLLYALGPTSARSFVGEDGQGSFPFCYDLCTALQLKQLIQSLRAAGRERGNPNGANAGGAHNVPATPVGGPGAGAVSGRGSGGGAAARGQFTDLTAAPMDSTGITAEQVVLSLAPRDASDDPTSLEALCAYSAYCTQEAMSVELSGGALAVARARAADALRYACQFPLAPVMMLCERAATVGELELALQFLLAATRAQPWNLQAMEKGHFYAILAQLLRRKARQGLVVVRTVEPLLAMVGRVRLVAEDGAAEHQLMPVNLQALQHLVFNFGIWRHAGPDVHRLILETLGAAVAISGSGGNEGQLAAQELNLRRFQFSGITRAVLYMLIEPEISYDLLLSMCDLVYLVLTRGTPPLEDLAAVSQLLAATASLRFQKLYVEGLIGSDVSAQQQQHTAGATTPRHHGHGGHGHSSSHRHGSGSGTPRRRSQHGGGAHDHPTTQARVLRLKVLRRGLLRLLIKVAEHYVLKAQQASKAASRPAEQGPHGPHGPSSPVPGSGAGGSGAPGGGNSSATAAADNEPLALFLRAIPPKLLLHLAYHFGDAPFWAGAAAGKPDNLADHLPFAEAAAAGVSSPMAERAMSPALGAGGAGPSGVSSPPRAAPRRRISASASTVLGGKRAARRHQDPTSALLAYQLLVAVMPYAQKPVDRLGGLAFLQHILPSAFKSIDVQSDADAAQLSSSSAVASPSSPTPAGEGAAAPPSMTWGRHYIWQPKALAYETQEVSAFFGQPMEDAVASICSPSFQHCLRTLYKTQFSHLLGGSSLFLTLEQVFDGLSSAAGAGTARRGASGKSLVPTQMIHVPGVLPPILATVSAAAGMGTTEGLIQTMSARPLARGDLELHQLLQHTPAAKALAASRAAAAGLVARKSLAFLHSLYLESQELREIFRGEVPVSMQAGGVGGGVASRFGRLPKPEELVEELAQVYYAGLMAQLAQRFTSAPEGAAAETEKLGESPVCQLALRFLLSVAFDRLLYSSKAVASIQALLDIWPRDLHLFHLPASGPDGDDEDATAAAASFAEALQAHFRSTVLHALMAEVRGRLTTEGTSGAAPSPYLSTAAYKLTNNLPRFFGLVAANTFLARSWPQSPFLPPLSGSEAVPQRDFWLLTSMQFLIDMLGLMVVPSSSSAEQGQLGVVFRSAKQQQAALAAAAGGAGAKPTSSFLGGQAKQAMGDLFGISKWMGDDVDEWVTAAVDGLRKALLTGLTWLEDGLLEGTVSKLFETAIRHLGLLLPQLHAPRAAEADKQFVAALLYLLYPLLSDEQAQYREASTYVWRELLASPPQRKILEALLSVPQTVTVKGKKGEPVEKVVTLNLLNCSNGTGTPASFACTDGPEGFDMILRINVHNFGFIKSLPKLPAPRVLKGLGVHVAPGGDFADKEFQSWLGSLPPDIQDKIPKALAQCGKAFRDWPEVGAAQALGAYRQSVVATEKRRRKGAHEALKLLTKTTATWRKELKAKQDVELRRQVRWPQERVDRETFGARRMEVVFAELIEGTSLAVAPGGVLLKGLGHGDGYLATHTDAGKAAEALVKGQTLAVDDGGLLAGMQRGVGGGDLSLDSAEGPMRIRKKLVRATFKLGRGSAPPAPLSLPSPTNSSTAAASSSPAVSRAPSMAAAASPRTPTRQGSSLLAKQTSLQSSIPVVVSPQTPTQQPLPPQQPPASPSVHFAPTTDDCQAQQAIPPEEAAMLGAEPQLPSSAGASVALAGSPPRNNEASAALGASADRDFFSSLEDEEEEEEEELLTEDEEDLDAEEESPEEGAGAGDDGQASGVGATSPGGVGLGDGAAAPAGGAEEGAASAAAENPNRRSLAIKTKQLKEQQRLVLNAGASSVEAQSGAAAMEGAADGQDPAAAAAAGAGATDSAEAAGEEEDEEAEGLVGADDKLKPFLVPGDEIRHRYNCARVQGVYAYPGIVLFCDHHLYIIDNYKLAESSAAVAGAVAGASPYEVVEIPPEEAAILQTPSSLQARSGAGGDVTTWLSTSSLQNNPVSISEQLRAKCAPQGRAGPSHRCHYFPFEEITVVYRRRYHLRHVALEVFLSNGENHLVTVDDPGTRNELLQKLKERCNEATTLDVKASPLDEIQTFLNLANPSSLTERWVRGEISNFQYIMHLNTLSGRSYNDLTQYPVFPWIIADWESEELDLSNPATFRDLTKPMGALSPAREMEFRERYALLKEGEQPGDPKKAFHYGTHFSSAAIVLYYLVRLQPFSEQHVRLQSGRFDHSDRLFSTMRKSWQASSGGLSAESAGQEGGSTNTQDVRELIPEFFYLPDFLTNPNGYDFGVELDGHRIDDVGLPPWAKGSAHEFIRLHRQALESEYVSRNLHHWIDLIWGYKQRGKAAEEACNVFYYLTYEGAIDLEAVEDPNLRKAYVEQIHEFGQTPSQLFRQPHPARIIPNPNAEREAAAGTGGAAGGVVGGIGAAAPQWLRNLKDRVPGAGRNTPSPQPPVAASTITAEGGDFGGGRGAGGMVDDGEELPPPLPMQHRASAAATAAGAGGRAALASSGTLLPGAAGAKGPQGAQPRTWAMTELRRVLTSEAALRLLPPRRTAACLPSKVAQWAAAAARASGQGDPEEPVNQVAIGQIVLGASPEKAPLALHAGCAGVGPASGDAFLAWGFADDCLRLGVATLSAEANGPGAAALALPERKLTVALDAAGPIAVLALSGDGRTLITGSSARPVIHVWSVQKGLGRRAPAGKRQPPVALLGTLISALHAGSITNVALSAKYGIVVSVCSHNRVALLWDLNRRRLVRQLVLATTGRAATDSGNDLVNVAIDETTGTIVLTAGTTIHVYDANGSPLATLDASSLPLRESLAATGGADASTSASGAGVVVSTVNVLKAPATPISACCVVGDGCAPTTIVTGHLDGHIRVWVLEYGKKQVVPSSALGMGALLGERKQLALTSGTMVLMASPLVTAAVPDEDDEESDDEEEDEEEEGVKEGEAGKKEQEAGAPSAGKTRNCLTLVNELSYCPAASPSLPSRAPITALTMAPDMRRFFSGDAAGVVCAWTVVSNTPAAGHTPLTSNQAPGPLGGGMPGAR